MKRLAKASTASPFKMDVPHFVLDVPQAAGGAVLQLFGTWRIEGSLAVARAIGDYEFSRYVSYHPTVMTKQLNHKDKWIIIGRWVKSALC